MAQDNNYAFDFTLAIPSPFTAANACLWLLPVWGGPAARLGFHSVCCCLLLCYRLTL